MTFAAGLAAGGMKPIFAVYSSFLQRAYDQTLHDVCLQNLPVVIAVDRAGLVGSDGETHQGVFEFVIFINDPEYDDHFSEKQMGNGRYDTVCGRFSISDRSAVSKRRGI